MNNNHLKKIPTCIFQVIQSYLTNKEYRNFMNCDLSTFQTIKYETIHYLLKISQSFQTSDSRLPLIEAFINHKVKDKSKQITLYLKHVTESDLFINSYIYDRVHKLVVKSSYMNDQFPFHVLTNNISHIILFDLPNICQITIGFENVQSLEINDCNRLISFHGIHMKRLERIKLINNYALKEIYLPFGNIIEVEIEDSQFGHFHDDCLVKNKIQKLKITGSPIDEKTFQEIRSILPTVECLELGRTDPLLLEGCMRVKELHLYFEESQFEKDPFPIFEGQMLSLNFYGGSLELWDSKAHSTLSFPPFSQLHTLELYGSKGIINFPNMPQLVDLLICVCSDLQEIPTLPKLRKLRIIECEAPMNIAPFQPSLSQVFLTNCTTISDLSFCARRLRLLKIRSLPNLRNISMLGQVMKLDISNCSNITSLLGLAGTSPTKEDGRKIILSGLNSLNDFSGLHVIDSLELRYMENLIDLHQIHDINHLIIEGCPKLANTKGLRSIFKSLEIRSCEKILQLEDVEDIPTVKLSFSNLNILD